jgi:glucose-1-phosphate cytidylyltransferase
LATITAARPTGRFGIIQVDDSNVVTKFQEKEDDKFYWINAGFFVLEPKIFDYISDSENAAWEQESLRSLVSDHQLVAFRYDGFWKPMDTLRDKNDLNDMWNNNEAPWKIWK